MFIKRKEKEMSKEFNRIARAIKEHSKTEAETLIQENIRILTDKECHKITKLVKKEYPKMK
jgi:hypothetical protein